jgi:hypothetical protein
MTNAQEKRVNRIAELKGFRLEKAGHGKGHGRFYIMNVAEGGRVRSQGCSTLSTESEMQQCLTI